MKEQSGGSAGPFNALIAQQWDNGKQVRCGCAYLCRGMLVVVVGWRRTFERTCLSFGV
jgi:hypothetical protein